MNWNLRSVNTDFNLMGGIKVINFTIILMFSLFVIVGFQYVKRIGEYLVLRRTAPYLADRRFKWKN